MKQLVAACLETLTQLEGIVTEISEEDFCRPSTALSGSTIGQHVRHTLEFFKCLQKGFENGTVNYDKRAHDKLLEENKDLAIESITRVREFVISRLSNKSLTLEVCYQRQGEDFCNIPTNYHRELMYTIEHAIHHMALMKIAVREIAPYLEMHEHVGVAVTTLRYREQLSD